MKIYKIAVQKENELWAVYALQYRYRNTDVRLIKAIFDATIELRYKEESLTPAFDSNIWWDNTIDAVALEYDTISNVWTAFSFVVLNLCMINADPEFLVEEFLAEVAKSPNTRIPSRIWWE